MLVSNHTPDASDLSRKKRKSRQENSSQANTQTESKPQRKSKDSQQDKTGGNEGDTAHSLAKKERTMKKRKREADGESGDDGTEKDVEKRAKKGSKRAKETEPDVPTTSHVSTKKRKNKTGFPDPNEDTCLADQTQKCLAYAFLQFHRPSKWKFNKARQNWLIRNIWSIEMIPETHLALALAYLAKVQGGVRENLLQSCRVALEPPKTEVPPSESAEAAPVHPTPAEPPVLSEVDKIKKSRARALIDLLSSSEEQS